MSTFSLTDPAILLPTEMTDDGRLVDVVDMILRAHVWLRPIVVADDLPLVMDGHHRLAAAMLLGLERVPVARLSYSEVSVEHWKGGEPFDVDEIYCVARSGKLFAPKTTRHRFPGTVRLSCFVPLARLSRHPLASVPLAFQQRAMSERPTLRTAV